MDAGHERENAAGEMGRTPSDFNGPTIAPRQHYGRMGGGCGGSLMVCYFNGIHNIWKSGYNNEAVMGSSWMEESRGDAWTMRSRHEGFQLEE